MENFIESLKRKAWITRGARFNAQRRTETHDSLSNLSISLLTVFVIGFNLLPFWNSNISSLKVGIFTLFLSIFILSISQFVAAKEFKVKAVRFHDCGRELGGFIERLEIFLNRKNYSLEDIEKLSKEYQNLIFQYDINHTSWDTFRFYIQHSADFKKEIGEYPRLYKLKIYTQYCLQYIPYCILAIVIPLICFIIILANC